MGRPSTGRVESAIRCVATKDLPAGSLVLSDAPGAPAPGVSAAAAPSRPAVPGDEVRVVSGALAGKTGTVLRLRTEDSRPIVRLDGKLVVMPPEKLAVLE